MSRNTVGVSASEPKITFVLNDAGETKAMQPVMQALDNNQVNYSIFAVETAKSLLKGNTHLAPFPEDVVQLQQDNPLQAQKAQQQLKQALSVPVVVMGVVSDFQKRWADYFKAMGKQVVGYYDSIVYHDQRNREQVDPFKNGLTSLITPAKDATAFFQKRFPNWQVLTLGQPTLESIPKVMANTNTADIAKRAEVDTSKPTILFVGEYEPGYREAFPQFVQSIQILPEGTNVVVSLHPKADGTFEREVLKKYDPQHRVRIISKSVTTAEMLPVADVILTWHSTMAMQAAFQGKTVMYVGADHKTNSFDPMMEYNMIHRYQTVDALTSALKKTVSKISLHREDAEGQAQHRHKKIEKLYQTLGIPMESTRRITDYLMSLLNQQPASKTAA